MILASFGTRIGCIFDYEDAGTYQTDRKPL